MRWAKTHGIKNKVVITGAYRLRQTLVLGPPPEARGPGVETTRRHTFRIGSLPPYDDRVTPGGPSMTMQASFSVAPVDRVGGTQHKRAVHNLTYDAAVQLLVIYHDADAPAANEAVAVAEDFGSGSHMNFLTGKLAVVIRN